MLELVRILELRQELAEQKELPQAQGLAQRARMLVPGLVQRQLALGRQVLVEYLRLGLEVELALLAQGLRIRALVLQESHKAMEQLLRVPR